MGDQYMSGGDLRPGMDRMRAPSQATLKRQEFDVFCDKELATVHRGCHAGMV